MAISLVAIALAAIIIPIIVLQPSGDGGDDGIVKNDYIRLNSVKQYSYGFSSGFNINYTVISEGTVAVICYLDVKPINYENRGSRVVGKNAAGTSVPENGSFNIFVDMGDAFTKTVYIYLTTRYKATALSSKETGFLGPVTVTLYRIDPSIAIVPDTTPEKPTINFALWNVQGYLSTYLSTNGLMYSDVGSVDTGNTYDCILNSELIFYSRYGQVSPGIGFNVYISVGGSEYVPVLFSRTDDPGSLSSQSGSFYVRWEGKYAMPVGPNLVNTLVPGETDNWTFYLRNYRVRVPLTWKQVYERTGSIQFGYKVITTFYGVESKEAATVNFAIGSIVHTTYKFYP